MSVQAYESNARKAAHFLGLLLAKALGDTNEDNGIAVLAGSGVPSGATYGGQTLATGQNALAIDADAASIDALIYGTVNGGTAWTAFAPGALKWYSGTISAPATDSTTGVHASNGDDVRPWAGPYTSPAVPRNVTITFGSAWAGGNVTITGTNQFDAAMTEVIVASAGNTVAGIKAFKTVTSITHASAGPGGLNHGASAGWGHKFGMAKVLSLALGVLTEDGNQDAAAWDATYCAFTPTALPNASRTYRWAVPT